MNDILQMIVAVEILANDIHYESKGMNFYSNHLLADRIKDGLSSICDSLREAYWIGELKTVPPRTDVTYEEAIKIARTTRLAIQDENDTSVLLKRCIEAVNALIHKIEEVKSSGGLLSGTTAILDSLSEKMQIANALLDRTIIA